MGGKKDRGLKTGPSCSAPGPLSSRGLKSVHLQRPVRGAAFGSCHTRLTDGNYSFLFAVHRRTWGGGDAGEGGGDGKVLLSVGRLQGEARARQAAPFPRARRHSSLRGPPVRGHLCTRRPTRATHSMRRRSPGSGTRRGTGCGAASRPGTADGVGDRPQAEEMPGSQAAGEASEALVAEERSGPASCGQPGGEGWPPAPPPRVLSLRGGKAVVPRGHSQHSGAGRAPRARVLGRWRWVRVLQTGGRPGA